MPTQRIKLTSANIQAEQDQYQGNIMHDLQKWNPDKICGFIYLFIYLFFIYIFLGGRGNQAGVMKVTKATRE